MVGGAGNGYKGILGGGKTGGDRKSIETRLEMAIRIHGSNARN